jgi:hypothetical protein
MRLLRGLYECVIKVIMRCRKAKEFLMAQQNINLVHVVKCKNVGEGGHRTKQKTQNKANKLNYTPIKYKGYMVA